MIDFMWLVIQLIFSLVCITALIFLLILCIWCIIATVEFIIKNL